MESKVINNYGRALTVLEGEIDTIESGGQGLILGTYALPRVIHESNGFCMFILVHPLENEPHDCEFASVRPLDLIFSKFVMNEIE